MAQKICSFAFLFEPNRSSPTFRTQTFLPRGQFHYFALATRQRSFEERELSIASIR